MQSPPPAIERRRHPRFSVRIPILLRDSLLRIPAALHDLFEAGCYVAGDQAVTVGSRAGLGMYLDAHDLCAGSGGVVRGHHSGFAIAFVDTNPAHQDFLWHMERGDERGRRRIVGSVCHAFVRIG